MAFDMSYADMMVLVWVLWGAALVFTVLRATLQWSRRGCLHDDDYFVFAGLLFLTALAAVITRLLPQFYLAANYVVAAAKDPTTPLPLPPDEFSGRTITSLKLMFCQMLLFWTTLWAAKFSILCFIRRVVDGLPRYIMVWWGVFTVVLLMYIACLLSNFLTCKPLGRYWSATGCNRPEDMPRSNASIKFATGADVAADLLTMLLPLHVIRTLNMSPMKKIGLGVVFSLGAIIVAFAFVRLAHVISATNGGPHDPATAASGPMILAMWSYIEATVAVIVATLPAFGFLLNRNRGSTNRSSNNHTIATIGGSAMNRRRQVTDFDGDDSSQVELTPVGIITKTVDFNLKESSVHTS